MVMYQMANVDPNSPPPSTRATTVRPSSTEIACMINVPAITPRRPFMGSFAGSCPAPSGPYLPPSDKSRPSW